MNEGLLRFKEYINGKRVSVIGIGVSNTPLIDLLLGYGAIVTAHDKKREEDKGELASALKSKGVTLRFGEDYLDNIEADLIFKAPGIRPGLPQFIEAQEKGAVLTNEMEVFFELCPGKIFAVTGSDGKTTTTTLIAKMLEKQFGHVYLGGNIGNPLLPEIEKMTEDDYVVVELSSFQLMAMKRSPKVAVITNLTPNHLDWHRDMDEYLDAKKNIMRYQNIDDRLVLNFENDATRCVSDDAIAEVTFFSSVNHLSEGVCEIDGWICHDGEKVLKTDDILLPGRHNVENYMAAIAATHGYVTNAVVCEIARTFGGVEHRIELVRTLDGVKYYNSSIDSSPTRTEAALRSFKQKVIVIMGGYDKQIPFEPLAEPVADCAKAVILTGATADKIAEAIKDTGVPTHRATDLKGAVDIAYGIATEGDVVILSPACASFDAYANFMERGNKFKEIVNGL